MGNQVKLKRALII